MTSTHYTPGRRERHPMTTVPRDINALSLDPPRGGLTRGGEPLLVALW